MREEGTRGLAPDVAAVRLDPGPDPRGGSGLDIIGQSRVERGIALGESESFQAASLCKFTHAVDLRAGRAINACTSHQQFQTALVSTISTEKQVSDCSKLESSIATQKQACEQFIHGIMIRSMELAFNQPDQQ
jgi:hypothetical protein